MGALEGGGHMGFFNAPQFKQPTFQCANCHKWYYFDDFGRAVPSNIRTGPLFSSEVPICCKCFTPSRRGRPLDPALWAGIETIEGLSISHTYEGLSVEGVMNHV
jgi:formate-dependent nitrite reductase cytochrome c552 subunit